MNKVNEIIICRHKHETQEEFENAIKNAIMLLINEEYICTVNCEEMGVVIIEYNYSEQEYGDSYPYWLYPEEFESIVWKDEKDCEVE